MSLRLHRGGKFRGWVGTRLGGDAELGDRAWRRFLHLTGVAVLFYFVIPRNLFVYFSTEVVLLLALELVLVLEFLRHVAGLELPTIRPYESDRIGSYTFYAIALVIAVIAFPVPIAVMVVLGTALVDPLIGELRRIPEGRKFYPTAPIAVYAALGLATLLIVGRWSLPGAILGALLAAVSGVATEYPKYTVLDDDLAMTVVPGALLLGVLYLWPSLPGWGS